MMFRRIARRRRRRAVLALLLLGVLLIGIASPLSVMFPRTHHNWWPMLLFVSFLRVVGLAAIIAFIAFLAARRNPTSV